MAIELAPNRGRTLASAAFKLWKDGTCCDLVEKGLPGGMVPYVVRLHGKSWIPLNVVLMAHSEVHARARIMQHLTFVRDNAKDEEEPQHHDLRNPKRMAKELLDGIESGALEMLSEPFPLYQISKVQWASNDGVIT